MSEALGSYAIFCDDIRTEANGKGIFIGVYRDAMFFVGNPPWVLPQFHINVVYRASADASGEPIRFEIRTYSEQGMKVLGALEPDFSATKDKHRPEPFRLPFEPSNITPMLQAQFNFALAPLVLTGDTRISVHAISQGRDTIIDRLRVLKSDEAEAFNSSMVAVAVRPVSPTP
ncbi:MAG: hypothetical protein P4M05_27395 [Bradyrhizobium sp.]|nr:hypothetical protein [Bradyrhizobium sp.]